MSRTRILVMIAVVLLGGGLAAGCTPQEVAVWSIIQIFGGGDPRHPLAQEALNVARCESGFNPEVVNQSGCCYGLFQINLQYHWPRFYSVGAPNGFWEWNNPWWNTLVAKQIYDEQGWKPWSCKP